MKKLSLYVFLGLLWCNVGFADTSIMSVKGMKLNESALKYFDKNLIESKKEFLYESKDYFMIFANKVQIHIRNNDKNYTIVGFDDGEFINFEDCKKKISLIVNQVKTSFPNAKRKEKGSAEEPGKHAGDPSGKSFIFGTDFYLNDTPSNGPVIRVKCTDWSDEIEKSKNWKDNFRKSINSKEFNLFLIEMYD